MVLSISVSLSLDILLPPFFFPSFSIFNLSPSVISLFHLSFTRPLPFDNHPLTHTSYLLSALYPFHSLSISVTPDFHWVSPILSLSVFRGFQLTFSLLYFHLSLFNNFLSLACLSLSLAGNDSPRFPIPSHFSYFCFTSSPPSSLANSAFTYSPYLNSRSITSLFGILSLFLSLTLASITHHSLSFAIPLPISLCLQTSQRLPSYNSLSPCHIISLTLPFWFGLFQSQRKDCCKPAREMAGEVEAPAN